MTQHHNFLPHTDADRQAMLAAIGVQSQDDLFADVPLEIRQSVQYSVLPAEGLSEQELHRALSSISKTNLANGMACFLGGGAYYRYVPPAVNTLALRSEFYTAYTPYQPEIAQGTLQYTYEFQTMISELTGMDVANAGVYDGATALTEGVLMALRSHKGNTVLLADSVNPEYRQVLEAYLGALGGINLVLFNPDQFTTEIAKYDPKEVACIAIQQPNYFGHLLDPKPFTDFCTANKTLFLVSAEPFSLALLTPPGEYGADIVTGDIQPLGNTLSFGGPYGGYMAVKEKHMRQLPGRLVGKTLDKNGNRCYTLTLQTREQHIKRERATSNICTNQALNVLKATVYMTLAGPVGLKTLSELSVQRAHHLAERLTQISGVKRLFPEQPFLNEFSLQLDYPVAEVLGALEAENILGGIALGRFYPEYPNGLLVCCTEMTLPEDIERYVTTLSRYIEAFKSGLRPISGTVGSVMPRQAIPADSAKTSAKKVMEVSR